MPPQSGYTFGDALIDYRRLVLFCHVYTVIALGSLNPANERGMRLGGAADAVVLAPRGGVRADSAGPPVD